MINEKHIDKADGVLTKLKLLLKKHWGILLLILLGWCIYLIANLEDIPPVDNEQYEEVILDDSSDYYEEVTNGI